MALLALIATRDRLTSWPSQNQSLPDRALQSYSPTMRLEKGGNARFTSSRILKLLLGLSVIGVLIFFFTSQQTSVRPNVPISDVVEVVGIFETEYGMLLHERQKLFPLLDALTANFCWFSLLTT